MVSNRELYISGLFTRILAGPLHLGGTPGILTLAILIKGAGN
jgi:hypothetical protein